MPKYVYSISTGRLASWSPDDDGQVAAQSVLDAAGLAVLTDSRRIDDGLHDWDEASRQVVSAPTVIPRMVKNYDFVQAFTPEEFMAIKASNDANIQQLFYVLGLAPDLDMNRADIQGGIQLLVSLGFLTPERAAVIAALGS